MNWTSLALLVAALAAPGAAAEDAAAAPPAPAAHSVLPFIADDYARALSEARRLDRPLFVEAWAPW